MKKRHFKTTKLTKHEKEVFISAIYEGKNDLVKEILKKIKDLNERMFEDQDLVETPLTLACLHGNKEIVKHLIELNADVNQTNNIDYSPLMHSHDFEISEMLINANANINFISESNESALSVACDNSDLLVVELLLSKKNLDIEKLGGKALINAVKNNNLKIVKLLVEAHANVNFFDEDENENEDEWEDEENEENEDESNWTPLHFACRNGNIDIVKLLLENGADKHILNCEGKTAVKLTKNEEIRELINNFETGFVLK